MGRTSAPPRRACGDEPPHTSRRPHGPLVARRCEPGRRRGVGRRAGRSRPANGHLALRQHSARTRRGTTANAIVRFLAVRTAAASPVRIRAGAIASSIASCITRSGSRIGALGRAERAEALKFLVHLVGDVHQPFHAIDVARGGNGLGVTAFGSTNCAPRGASPFSCTLHGVWDSTLVAHRRLNDDRYIAELEREHAEYGWKAGAGSPADWANESHAIAKKALLPAGGIVDEAYFRGHLHVIDEQLMRAGLRLAALLNKRLG